MQPIVRASRPHRHALSSVCALDQSWEVIIGRLIPTTRATGATVTLKERFIESLFSSRCYAPMTTPTIYICMCHMTIHRMKFCLSMLSKKLDDNLPALVSAVERNSSPKESGRCSTRDFVFHSASFRSFMRHYGCVTAIEFVGSPGRLVDLLAELSSRKIQGM